VISNVTDPPFNTDDSPSGHTTVFVISKFATASRFAVVPEVLEVVPSTFTDAELSTFVAVTSSSVTVYEAVHVVEASTAKVSSTESSDGQEKVRPEMVSVTSTGPTNGLDPVFDSVRVNVNVSPAF
jgi:hypothetical protein